MQAEKGKAMTGGAVTETESKRGRVRRLLIDPLERAGMRSRKGADPDQQRAFLDRLCDDLAYLSDRELGVLRSWAEVSGEGRERCFWPPFVAFASAAQAIAPRPVAELPELRSWFGSVAGPAAARVPGRLVAEFRFIQRYRRPPIKEHERREMVKVAGYLATDVERARELRDRGRMHDAEMLAAFERDEATARALVRDGEAKRGEVPACA